MKQKLVARKIAIAAAVLSGVVGFGLGMATITFNKAARLADDIHEVKQDFDKSKHRVAEDYRHAADKAKEVLDNTDAKELGKKTKEGALELGGLLKDKLKKKLSESK